METRITKLLGSKYPMIQGGMAAVPPLITCGNRFVSARKKRRTRSA